MKRTLVISGACLIALLLVFVSTDPNKLPSILLVLPFLLFFILLFLLLALLFKTRGLNHRKSLQSAALCASVPLLLLILQSIGQLTTKDVLTIVALFIISYFYISRTTTTS